jgi:uncharacterized protein (TIGR03118 family)
MHIPNAFPAASPSASPRADLERAIPAASSLKTNLGPSRFIAIRLFALCLGILSVSGIASAQAAGVYQVTNIISDGSVPATITDPKFIDPWGVSGTATLWINTNVTGLSYVTPFAGPIKFEAVIPAASGSGPGQPTGTVQNTTTGFVLSNGTKASFLFATSDGTISGWNSLQTAGGNNALIQVNSSSKNAVYTDLALITNSSGSYLLVPNFGQGGDVEVYNSSFAPATLAGTFTDPNIPTGYAPYAIKAIGTQVFVTYMLRTTPPFAPGAGTYQEILGTNTGFVSVFDDNGNFIARAVTGGNLNAPWGVTIAPAGFGIYGGDLLIGNFGDGLITAYNPTTYAFLGVVADMNGNPIAYPGLWEIFGSTASGANPSALYFTAGLDQETHGLFAEISNNTAATTTPTFNLSASSQVASVTGAGASTSLTISIAPVNGFTGTVSLACSGMPVSSTCTFAPATLTASPTAPVTGIVTIQASNSAALHKPLFPGFGSAGLTVALLLPFGSTLLLFRRRSQRMIARFRLLALAAILCIAIGLVTGCASQLPLLPRTTQVTITATSGSITQSTIVALTVNPM